MVLQFQPPPDWLIQDYLTRKSPGQQASDSVNQAFQTYAASKDSQQKENLAQQQKDIEMAKGLAANGQDFTDALKQVQAARTQPQTLSGGASLIDRAKAFFTGSTTGKAPIAGGPDASAPSGGMPVIPPAPPPSMGNLQNQVATGPQMATPTPNASFQPPMPSTGTAPAPAQPPLQSDPLMQEYLKDPVEYKRRHGEAGITKLKTQADLDKALTDKPTDKYYTTDQSTKMTKDNKNAADVIATFPKDQVPRDVVHLLMTQGNKDLTVGTKESNQQDKLEQQYRQSFQTIRGDPSIKRSEEQRDAAAIAYNRIKEVKDHGQVLNPIDYVDVLGQIYKARTGSAPTNEVLASARQATAKGSLDKAFTYMTGQQAPATTEDIMTSLQDMAQSMGQQADKFHDGYMRNRIKPPLGLAHDRVANVNAERGMSFAEATGQNQAGGSSDIPTVGGAFHGGKVLKVTKIK